MRTPVLSVILVTPDRIDRLAGSLSALRRQTAADRLELVVVVPSRTRADVDAADFSDFAAYRIVETGPTPSAAVRRAAGVRAATAPVVAFTEDHCFPEPAWAEALIAAHEGPWAAVGPVVENGNPDTLTSWVNLFVEYGPWIPPRAAGSVGHLPGHNSSYKRELLLAYGDDLAEMLESETVLQWDLRAGGHELYLEPTARTRHFNFSLISATIPLRLAVGRMFGASRSRAWSLPKRVAFVAASPLIPLVRFARLVPVVRRTESGRLFPRALPALVATLVFDGAGQLLGYALGGGDAEERVTRFEHDRANYMRLEERGRLARP